MSTERDELALAMRQNFSGWMGPSVSYDVADAILAAGYRKAEIVWDEGRKHGATYPYGKRGLATDDNPYRSQP